MAPSIALFDYFISDPHATTGRAKPTAYGAIHFQLLEALCDDYDFTVFAIDFDNPRPDRINFVPVRAVLRPLALLFITYHLGALWAYARERLRRRRPFDVVQSVESNFLLPTVSHAQFCHKAFLRKGWPVARPSGVRRPLRRIDYQLRRAVEPFVYRRAHHVATSSTGLLDDIVEAYPWVADRCRVVGNPIDLTTFTPGADFDRRAVRTELGVADDDVLLAFTALGDFELKGLPLLFDALTALGRADVHLVCLGGPPHLVEDYQKRASRAGLDKQVHVLGMQPDVRPFLWAADAFVFPSAYESFSVATAHAAAAGLPVILTPFHLAKTIVRDGENGYLIERSAPSIVDALERFLANPPAARVQMGEAARAAVQPFSPDRFVAGWRSLYAQEQTSPVSN
ncbi:MAG: glycosyltransferase family 4 protein [Acidimicrobiia bacterium]|nr:glycosyltransferase family 4 protein [Acidimicrobiia bacterium]